MKSKLILIAIIVLGFILRFYMLSSVPAGLTSDEANSGYDAYSILLTGKDQWGSVYPLVSFKGFGDFRMPLYTYLIVPFISLLDLNSLSVRIPSAMAGVISIYFIYLLVRKLFNEKTGLVAAFLLSVSPWAVGLSRQGLESNVAITFYILGIFTFLKTRENNNFLYLSAILFILTCYTYTSYIIFAPLTFLVLCIWLGKKIFKLKKELIISGIVSIFILLPIVLGSSAGNTRFSQIGFTNDISSTGLIEVLNQKIGSCYENVPNFVCRVTNNKLTTFISTFAQNYLNHFSFDFLYIKGTTTQFSLLYERGLFYLYGAAFFVVGLFTIIKSKKNLVIIALLLLSAIPDTLSGGGHHSRASSMLPFIIIIESVGLVFIFSFLNKKRLIGNVIKLLIILIISYSFITFVISYFSYFNKHFSSYSLYTYKELSKKIADYEKKYNNIFISNYLNDDPQYIFYLFYNKYDPKRFQEKSDVKFKQEENGFIKFEKIGNLNFGNFRYDKEISENVSVTESAIIIAHPDAFPKDIKRVKEFKDLSGGVIFIAVEPQSLAEYISNE